MSIAVYLYRWKIKPGKERQFEESWEEITKSIRAQCGSYGSRLHKNVDGEYVAYAQWPDTKSRQACVLDSTSLADRVRMREAIELSSPDEQLTVISDQLIFPSAVW
jgi:heme-degrading monooxygenase HmoA